jgi:hypothetical protein
MCGFASHNSQIREALPEPHFASRRLPKGCESQAMKNETGQFGIILGGIVALAALLFIVSGGSLGGKTTVDGDKDLPPIANPEQ